MKLRQTTVAWPHARIVSRIATGIACAVLVAACATTTSSTGRKQYVGALSSDQLNQLGTQAFLEAKNKKPQTQDGKQSAYVRCVVDAIVAQLPPQWRQTAWEEAVFVDAEPNAFALPGGKVGVNTGIFTVARNQDQLAAVIGHEIGHVTERHHDERVTRQAMAQFGVNFAEVLVGSRYGNGAAQTTGQLGGAAAIGLFVLPNSRDQETEADVVGQRLMAGAGFDPRQAVELWRNMQQASSGNRPPKWLSTHPDPTSRIGALQKRADGLVPAYEQARAAGRKPHCS